MRILKLMPLLFLAVMQLQQRGCDKENKPTLKELTADAYDMYLLDMPYAREIYQQNNIKDRSMMEVSTVDLPAEEGYIVRKDSFGMNGRIIKSSFMMEGEKDSLRYEYLASGQIERIHSFNQDADSTSLQYVYDKYGMLKQVVYFRKKMLAYNFSHNKYGKMTDKRLSNDSPTYSPIREIYRYNGIGNMISSLTLSQNIPTAKQQKYYDKKNRITKTEELANGIVMSSSTYFYNDLGLLSIRKDWFRISSDEEEIKVYEFLYEYYLE
ncbi:MAG: hypothetical protein ACI94Y_003856 [Maribacter sp.]|jgi:hypothetical protein